MNGSANVVTISDADKQNYKETIVKYNPNKEGRADMAVLVSEAIPNSVLEIGKTDPGVKVEVTIGKKFRTKPIVQIVGLEIPEPGELPEVCQ